MSALEQSAAAKARGNAAFSAKNFPLAIEEYTKAIQFDPTQHALYSNRSASHASLSQYEEALADAEKCVSIKPDWPKAYNRQAHALFNLDRLEEAKTACEVGLKLAPSDAGLQGVMKSITDSMANPMGKLFGPSMWGKLAADPTTSAYLADPNFVNKMKMIQANPNSFTQMLQSDTKVAQALGVLMGMGSGAFSAMGGGAGGPGPASGASEEEIARAQAEQEREAQYRRQQEAKAQAQREKEQQAAELAAELEAERLAELEAMSPEEKQALADKARALEVKDEGNAVYLKKDFAGALAKYAEAIALDPTNPTFHTNVAAVKMAQRDFDGCVAACRSGLQVADDNKEMKDKFKFKAKAWLRIGNARLLQKDYGAAIEAYDASLLEDTIREAKTKKQTAQTKWAAQKKKDYLDPEKAQEAKVLGNTLYGEGKFPQAIEAYTDAIKRDPTNHVFYSNRANCYAKLMQFGSALADCDSCIKIQPDFAKIYIRKGKIQHFLKQYKQAIETFDIGLAIEPTSTELVQGKRQTLQKIAEENASGNVDPERQRQAMQDPEIQRIMRDPVISNVLNTMQNDPAGAQRAMQDPDIAEKINKLIQAGILRVG